MKKVVGRPFVKGQSGNPTGRPKMSDADVQLRETLRAAGPEAARRLAELVTSSDPQVSLKACMAVLQRLLGDVAVGFTDESKDGASQGQWRLVVMREGKPVAGD